MSILLSSSVRLFHVAALRSFSAAAASNGVMGSGATASPRVSATSASSTDDLRGVPERAARRIADMFYSPDVSLSRRQQTVFARLEDAPPLAAAPDHGFLYGLSAADVAGASEAVRRALSTRTGSLEDMRKFRAADIVKRFGATETDTGASRVQGACFRKRLDTVFCVIAMYFFDRMCSRECPLPPRPSSLCSCTNH